MRPVTVFGIAALVVSPVFAQEAPPAEMQPVAEPAASAAPAVQSIYSMSQGSGAIDALPLETKGYGDIKYITGGVGDEELEQLKSQAGSYNVHLLIAATGGQYLGEASLRIADAAGKEVLPKIDDVGPYFYVSLKPGKYMVEVISKQETKTVSVNVPASGAAKPVLRFNQ